MSNINRVFLLLKSYLNFNRPSYLIFFVTSKCNSHCKMCFNWKNIKYAHKRQELDLKEIEMISKKLRSLFQLTLSGGEPFLREDLDKIVNLFYINSGTRSVTLPTNALLFKKIEKCTENILKKCPDLLLNVDISLDGIGRLHDYIRGVSGNFKSVLETYRRLKKLRSKYSNLIIKVTTVLSYYNKNKIKELLNYVKENMEIDEHEIILVRGKTKNKKAKNLSLTKYKRICYLVKESFLKNSKKKNYQFSELFYAIRNMGHEIIIKSLEEEKEILPCLAGKKLIILYDNGDLAPCEILKYKIGNVREYDYNINKAIKSKKSKRILEKIRKRGCFCSFECAICTNIIFNFRSYPRLFKKIFFDSYIKKNNK